MSKTKKTTSIEDWNGFFEEIQKESPRAAIIISAAFMDEWLRELIVNFMVDSKVVESLLGQNRPLSSFSSRISTAYCLGLISSDQYDDLILVRNIRNEFAHGMHGLSIDDPHIVKWCNELKIPKKISVETASHWFTFLTAIAMLASQLAIRAKGISERRLTVPQGFTLTTVVKG